MNARTPPMQDATLIDALNRATSLELYQLSALVERLMTDPRRIVAVRKDLHLGQTVRFYDARRDVMREGRVVEMRDARLTLHDVLGGLQWKLPYAAVEVAGELPVDAGAARPQVHANAEPASPAPPAPPKPVRADFARGDKVSFTDRHLQTHIGIITRSNPKTASVDTGDASWSVPYGKLRSVLDI